MKQRKSEHTTTAPQNTNVRMLKSLHVGHTIDSDNRNTREQRNNKEMMNHSGQTNSLQTAYQDHLYRRQGLALGKELIKLVIDLQKHRGCTLAILSGDHFFETQLYGIQRDITEQFDRIESLRKEYLSLEESMHIVQEWVCIRRQWVSDTPEANFLLHSNLISELLKLIWRVVQRSGQLGLHPSHDRLVSLCFRDWLKIIETTAQARGLATHCAVLEHNPPEIRSRLNFLKKQLSELNDQFQAALDECSEDQAQVLTLSIQRVEYHDHLQRFLNALNEDFCHAEKPALDADTIYTFGSHAVSACQQILFTTLKRLDSQLSPELKAWVDAGVYQKTPSPKEDTPISMNGDDPQADNAYATPPERILVAK